MNIPFINSFNVFQVTFCWDSLRQFEPWFDVLWWPPRPPLHCTPGWLAPAYLTNLNLCQWPLQDMCVSEHIAVNLKLFSGVLQRLVTFRKANPAGILVRLFSEPDWLNPTGCTLNVPWWNMGFPNLAFGSSPDYVKPDIDRVEWSGCKVVIIKIRKGSISGLLDY